MRCSQCASISDGRQPARPFEQALIARGARRRAPIRYMIRRGCYGNIPLQMCARERLIVVFTLHVCAVIVHGAAHTAAAVATQNLLAT